VKKRTWAALVAVLAVGALACGAGPESCGRKGLTRYKSDGVVERCVPDADGHGLHWQRGL
jgi:hypothetical protein